MRKTKYGTKEWAEHNVNFCTGCSHDCRYCFAKSQEVHRFKRLTSAQWPLERVRIHNVKEKHKKYDGRVMIPSTHDITPNNLNAAKTVIGNLLEAGNEVLIVSKPHLDCIRVICDAFGNYRDLFEEDDDGHRQYKIIFRFSIGAFNDRLSYWEPGAPSYSERKAALRYAYQKGFQTSVSAEPMLDSYRIDDLINDLSPYVSESFWIGKMSKIGYFGKNADPILKQAIARIESGQSDAMVKAIYQRHRNNPLIRWKDSISQVIEA